MTRMDREDLGEGIALWAHHCKNRTNFIVRFLDQDQAIAWIEERKSTHAVTQIEGEPIPETAERLLDYLYPSCEHGLSASLCVGPTHYPMEYGYGY